MRFQDGQTLLFVGDSITDCGRDRSEDPGAGLGNGYVALVRALLTAHAPELRLRFLNRGIGGDRITDLEARWQRDVLAHRPDWLIVLVGINDVWRHFDRILMPGQVDLERFHSTYDALLGQTRNGICNRLLMSPFYLEPNREEPLRAQMDAYGRVVRDLAQRHDALFVDLQAAFDALLVHRPTQSLCGDRVHPDLSGHAVIARALLNAVSFQWR